MFKHSRYYTIQIAPDGPGKVHHFRIARTYIQLLVVLSALVFFTGGVVLWKLAEINAMLLSSRFLKTANEKLLAKHQEYEKAFEELDSIYSMEGQIQNILQTYMENDSGKIASLLDRNKFKHITSEKTRVHLDRIYEDEQGLTTKLDFIPSILPIVGTVSKKFSEEEDHMGIDFAANIGEPVFATAFGTITFCGDKGDLGLTVVIDHRNGLQTSYSHLGSLSVRKGDYVKKGETIGSVGVTGNTSGPHLHYQILKDDKPQDPQTYFNE